MYRKKFIIYNGCFRPLGLKAFCGPTFEKAYLSLSLCCFYLLPNGLHLKASRMLLEQIHFPLHVFKSFSKIAELWSGDITNIAKLLFKVVVSSCTLVLWRAHSPHPPYSYQHLILLDFAFVNVVGLQ